MGDKCKYQGLHFCPEFMNSLACPEHIPYSQKYRDTPPNLWSPGFGSCSVPVTPIAKMCIKSCT